MISHPTVLIPKIQNTSGLGPKVGIPLGAGERSDAVSVIHCLVQHSHDHVPAGLVDVGGVVSQGQRVSESFTALQME